MPNYFNGNNANSFGLNVNMSCNNCMKIANIIYLQILHRVYLFAKMWFGGRRRGAGGVWGPG